MEISLTRSQVAAFTLQLSIMIDSGVPLLRALEALTTSGEDGPALLAERVCVQLHRGSSLSAALRNFPRLFDRTFTGSLKVGEKTGCLHLVLANLARADALVIRPANAPEARPGDPCKIILLR